jgi:site-specific DNA-methyltransferase (adenine-specific)
MLHRCNRITPRCNIATRCFISETLFSFSLLNSVQESNRSARAYIKSGTVGRGDVSKLNNDRTWEGAELGVFLTLEPLTKGMREEASAAGFYTHELMNRSYPRIQIVTIEEIVEQHKRLDIPISLEVLKKAQAVALKELQPELFTSE